MRKIVFATFILLSFFIVSCDKNSDPISSVENNPPIHYPVGHCSFFGIEIQFEDTCSYNFITTFLSTLDSIVVLDTYLGSTFYLYADSGDYNYWLNYFNNDSTIQNMSGYNSSDSLILVIRLTGQKSQDEEEQKFLEIKNLKIIKIEEYPNLVYIDVPDNTETRWADRLEQYPFILYAYPIYMCTNS